MSSEKQQYALLDERDGGVDVYVHLEARDLNWPASTVAFEWDEGLSVAAHRTPEDPTYSRGWYWAPALEVKRAPDRVVIQYPEQEKVVGYAHDEFAVIEKYPAEITVERYRELADDESGGYDRVAAALYEPVMEPYVMEPKVITDFMLLTGRPCPPMPEGVTFEGTLPHTLRYQNQFVHLFPGKLRFGDHDGYAGRLANEIKAHFGPAVPYAFSHSRPGIELTLSVGRVTEKLVLNVGTFVTGTDVWDALGNMVRIRRESFAKVEAVLGQVCPHCNGSGTTLPPPPPPPKSRRRRSR